MSALPPKADICSALGCVCFGPEADAHISDAEFVAAAEQLGALHVRAARTLIQRDLEEN